MYRLKGKKPELSHNLIIKYDSAEQLAVLESVWEEAVDKSYRTQDEGYFGLSSGGDCVLVWYNYEYDDTVIPFLDVFEEVNNNPTLEVPYTAKEVFSMIEDGPRRMWEEHTVEQQEALDSLFNSLIIPRAKAGYRHTGLFWGEEGTIGEKLANAFTHSELTSALEEKGFTVEFEYIRQLGITGVYHVVISRADKN